MNNRTSNKFEQVVMAFPEEVDLMCLAASAIDGLVRIEILSDGSKRDRHLAIDEYIGYLWELDASCERRVKSSRKSSPKLKTCSEVAPE